MLAPGDFSDRPFGCPPDIEWRRIPSAPGYWASSEGRIKGLKGGILIPSPGKRGYLRVLIYGQGKKRIGIVNRLVCEAFHGAPPSSKHHAAHDDGVVTHNAATNLRWATPKENHADRQKHGTWPTGEKNGNAILTAKQVTEIREFYKKHRKGKQIKHGLRIAIAEKLGVPVNVIRDVMKGASWKSVP